MPQNEKQQQALCYKLLHLLLSNPEQNNRGVAKRTVNKAHSTAKYKNAPCWWLHTDDGDFLGGDKGVALVFQTVKGLETLLTYISNQTDM